MDREMRFGERVEVLLRGIDDEWFAATVTGKTRKQQVTLDKHPFGREPFDYEADESNIVEWRSLADQAIPREVKHLFSAGASVEDSTK